MRNISLTASITVLALLASTNLARADMQTNDALGKVFASTFGGDTGALIAADAGTGIAKITSSSTVNPDGSVTVTTTTTYPDGTIRTHATTTYPNVSTPTPPPFNGGGIGGGGGGGGSGGGGGGGGMAGIGQAIIPALMGGIMQPGSSGGIGNMMGGAPSIGGAGSGVTGGMNGSSSHATKAGTKAGTTASDKEAAKAEEKKKEEEEKKKKAEECTDKSAEKEKTGSQTADNPGKAADDAGTGTTATDDKEDPCKDPEYDTPAPTGDGTIKTAADAQAIVDADKCVTNKNQSAGNNASCQCVSLTKELGGINDPASTWRPGAKVQGNMDIPVGTPIATFNGPGNSFGSASMPGGKPGFSHTGIYLGQNATGIQILHQYTKAGAPIISTIPWNSWSGGTNEAGNKYYVIANKRTSWLELLWPYEQRLAAVLLNGRTVWYITQG